MTGAASWLFILLAQVGHGTAGTAGEQDVGAEWNAHMMEEVADAHHLHLPFLGTLGPEIHLRELFPPLQLQIGGLSIDLSPTKHVVYLFVAAVLVAMTMIWTARRTHGGGAERAPRGLANVIEAFVIYLRDEVAMRNIGPGGERYVPFVLTLFFFIFYMNIMGLVPFGATATGNISVTAALAALSLVVIEVGGALHLGRSYIKTVVYVPEGLPILLKIPIAVIMTPVEIIAKLARIFALAIRLFANMTAGHLVILSLIGLIFLAGAAGAAKWAIAPAPVLMAVAIMLMEIFIALLQAYIFAMLTSVFIGLVRHPH